MPLEQDIDTSSNKYISDLNPLWPLGSDYPDGADDHLRGIKNALKRTFPSITGPVTLTQDQLNRGSIPKGSKLTFYQANPPEGWTRVTGLTNTYALRVVATATAGGTSGGTDDPVVCSKVASHTHVVSGAVQNETQEHTHQVPATATDTETQDHQHYVPAAKSGGDNEDHQHRVPAVNTGGQAGDHYHTGTTDLNGTHTHTVPGTLDGGGSIQPGNAYGDPRKTNTTSPAPNHQHGFTTGGAVGNHVHYIAPRWTDARNTGHTHNTTAVWTTAKNTGHTHPIAARSTQGRSASHNHAVNITSVANAGAANWTPRYLDVILCERI